MLCDDKVKRASLEELQDTYIHVLARRGHIHTGYEAHGLRYQVSSDLVEDKVGASGRIFVTMTSMISELLVVR